MFADASALTAILADEPDAPALLARMQRYSSLSTSPLAVWETTVAVARLLNFRVSEAADVVEQFLLEAKVEVRDIPAQARFAALDAFARYGKGRHPAALNLGDCFAYACAKNLDAPLLYKGEDFDQTDIAPA